jgi:hypothetical protein
MTKDYTLGGPTTLLMITPPMNLNIKGILSRSFDMPLPSITHDVDWVTRSSKLSIAINILFKMIKVGTLALRPLKSLYAHKAHGSFSSKFVPFYTCVSVMIGK